MLKADIKQSVIFEFVLTHSHPDNWYHFVVFIDAYVDIRRDCFFCYWQILKQKVKNNNISYNIRNARIFSFRNYLNGKIPKSMEFSSQAFKHMNSSNRWWKNYVKSDQKCIFQKNTYCSQNINQKQIQQIYFIGWTKEKKNRRNLIRAQIIICEMNKHRKRIKLFVNSKIVFFSW